MNDVPDNAGLETFTYCRADAQHLKATYGFTFHETDGRIVLSFVRANSQDPTGVEWSVPIKECYEGILIKVLDDGTLKFIGSSNDVIDPKFRLQL